MRGTMLRSSSTRDAHAERIQAQLDDIKVQRTRRTGGMARSLPDIGQILARNQRHSNAIRAAHARRLRTALAKKPTARIHQLLETVPSCLHREFQIHIQETD